MAFVKEVPCVLILVLLRLTQYHLVSDHMTRLVCKLLILKAILIKFAMLSLSKGLETLPGQPI